MNNISPKRKAWLAQYKAMKAAYTPTGCARCRMSGKGWKENGGDFEPHHIARRDREWQVCLFVPLCHRCHHEVEHNAKKARVDQWIIKPKERSMFD